MKTKNEEKHTPTPRTPTYCGKMYKSDPYYRRHVKFGYRKGLECPVCKRIAHQVDCGENLDTKTQCASQESTECHGFKEVAP